MNNNTAIDNSITNRTCPTCGTMFIPYRHTPNQIYCSNFCRRDRVVKQCERCNTQYEVVRRLADCRRFCSAECKRSPVVTSVCCNCEIPFTHPKFKLQKGYYSKKFCCKDCYDDFRKKPVIYCVRCGKAFVRGRHDILRGRGKYCSIDCMKTRVASICIGCGKSFEALPSRLAKGFSQYCTRDCYNKTKGFSPEPTVQCSYCHSNFTCEKKRLNQKSLYCSLDCYYEHAHRRNAELVNCGHCGKEIKRFASVLDKCKTPYCSFECRVDGQHGDRTGSWEGGKSSEPYPVGFNEWLKTRIRNNFGQTCQLCGVAQSNLKRKLCVHHIDYDKLNLSETNLIPLCDKCHGKTNAKRGYWEKYFKDMIDVKMCS